MFRRPGGLRYFPRMGEGNMIERTEIGRMIAGPGAFAQAYANVNGALEYVTPPGFEVDAYGNIHPIYAEQSTGGGGN